MKFPAVGFLFGGKPGGGLIFGDEFFGLIYLRD